jgi:hypothetical protein
MISNFTPGVIPKRPRSYQRAEGSPLAQSVVAGDPSLRLNNGCAQDDAMEKRILKKSKPSHYQAVCHSATKFTGQPSKNGFSRVRI